MRSAQASIVELDKGKRYRIFVEAGRDPRTGKRRRLSKTIRGSRKDAEREKTMLLIKAGDPSALTSNMTLDDFFNGLYLPNACERLRPDTIDGYVKDYNRLIMPKLGGYGLKDITPAVVDSWLSGIDGQKRRKVAHSRLRLILSRAVKLGLVPENVAKRVETPAIPQRDQYSPEVLDAEDVQVYLWHFMGTDIEAAVLMAVGCGLRRSEIVALDWRDISNGAVIVDNAITVIPGDTVDAAPKSKFSTRVVHMPRKIAERMEQLRGPDDSPLLIVDGARMHPDALSRRYKRHIALLPDGVPRCTLKNLRHTSLTLAVEAGADILAVSRRAGHSNVAITNAFYLRPHDTLDRGTADGMDTLL